MSETWWAVESPDGYEEFYINQEDAAESARKYVRLHGMGNVRILEVDIRPAQSEPCEWELKQAPAAIQNGEQLPDSTNLQRVIAGGFKYCPNCGRSID